MYQLKLGEGRAGRGEGMYQLKVGEEGRAG